VEGVAAYRFKDVLFRQHGREALGHWSSAGSSPDSSISVSGCAFWRLGEAERKETLHGFWHYIDLVATGFFGGVRDQLVESLKR
tara:strand:+ start:430 stop:681 length:252 start_codon:yes stop_codon:yes gene_type:complete